MFFIGLFFTLLNSTIYFTKIDQRNSYNAVIILSNKYLSEDPSILFFKKNNTGRENNVGTFILAKKIENLYLKGFNDTDQEIKRIKWLWINKKKKKKSFYYLENISYSSSSCLIKIVKNKNTIFKSEEFKIPKVVKRLQLQDLNLHEEKTTKPKTPKKLNNNGSNFSKTSTMSDKGTRLTWIFVIIIIIVLAIKFYLVYYKWKRNNNQ
ncbi:hypothetical protein AAJ76_840007392 [Vairimorpha ceranae]|uniref:Uncharacterized protein n=1 Tax=Vairimorpha ceranae TaxID=40302 RepID=A0A0F9Z901_9MICR|nr:hypothetical protein AAJ76_840007392 [Vairimorpha ceranae]KAF5139951.1 hypothetical protein G9O61_00g018710 [Vairimorpha ceranae]KKO74314.1 hypothetical protein AAJ76_840007392 [Vairimorpha ceranae]